MSCSTHHAVAQRCLCADPKFAKSVLEELKGTLVLRLPLDESSAKVRTGPPKDDDADLGLPVWAGVVPLRLVAGEPIADEGAAAPWPGYDLSRPATSAAPTPQHG